jgi:hypothetical protein
LPAVDDTLAEKDFNNLLPMAIDCVKKDGRDAVQVQKILLELEIGSGKGHLKSNDAYLYKRTDTNKVGLKILYLGNFADWRHLSLP